MEFTISNGGAVRIISDQQESDAVKIAAKNLRTDLKKVLRVRFAEDSEKGDNPLILVGTLGVSECIQPYVSRVDFTDENSALRKEAYLLKVCEKRLIIAGSDRRGTIYGIYELCEMLGVSPWYFWADVPVRERTSFSLQDGYRKFDYPGIEYRGIFINDEEELDRWVRLHMGEDTIGVKTYEKIFELLLRLKGNYIWPAMHVNSFNMKKENGALADKMGVVVGTSHCDMLMRSNNREWKPWLEKKGYTGVKYDYSIEGRNREILQEYWRESVEQNREFEVSYTLGMRGIHDSGFETENLHAETEEELRQLKIKLLEQIIHDQEDIISEVLGSAPEKERDAEAASELVLDDGHDGAVSEYDGRADQVMKLFIPYKEVLELYDNGLQLPEDLTLVWSNDNYGYVRRYPSKEAQKRKGGNGIYYHNSYWAPPGRSYLFISSIPLAQTKYELEKAYDNGIRRLWVTNMGAIKPLEQEMEFVLRLGWETGKENEPTAECPVGSGLSLPTEQVSAKEGPKRIWRRTADVDDYLADWIDRNFTGSHGLETAALLNDFAQVTNTRKIELMEEDVFPQTGTVNEAVVRFNKLHALYQKGNMIYESLPEGERAAFFEMVLMKIHAAYYTGAMYYFADRSALLAGMERGGSGQKSAAIDADCGNESGETAEPDTAFPGKCNENQEAAQCVEYTRFFEDMRRRMLLYYNKKMCSGKWNGIVTPEDFPPPRTSMFPAAVPPVNNALKQKTQAHSCTEAEGQNSQAERQSGKEQESDGAEILKEAEKYEDVTIEKDIVAVSADSLSENNRSAGWRVIKHLGRGGGDLLEAYEPGAAISYQVLLPVDGDYLLELHRYPSLNSVGRIRIRVQADDGEEQVLGSLSNDEWRGNWEINTLDQVDRLYLKLPGLSAGRHEIHFRAMDRYFAFSGFVLYPLTASVEADTSVSGAQQGAAAFMPWQERAEAIVKELPGRVNCICFRSGDVSLPGKDCVEEAQKIWYSDLPLSPRPLIRARWESGGDSLGATDEQLSMEEALGKEAVTKTTAEELLAKGECIFKECDGSVKIDAFAAWGRDPYANMTNYSWAYCASETHDRSGIAMHIREKNREWDSLETAPSLHYRFSCTGGAYTIWALTYVTCAKNGRFAVCVDDTPVTKERLYRGGNLWKYEAEHIWRLTPIAKVELAAGEHLFSFSAFASGLRVDRFMIESTSVLYGKWNKPEILGSTVNKYAMEQTVTASI